MQITTDRDRFLKYEWKSGRRNFRSWCSGLESSTLKISSFCKEYEGTYTCTVSEHSKPEYFESLSVRLTFTGKLVQIHTKVERFALSVPYEEGLCR